jgi:hypothetical protein
VGIQTDANATEERCFLRCPCRDVYKKDKSRLQSVSGVEWSELDDCCVSVLVSCCCEKEKLVAEGREQFGNPEERERPPLEAVTRKLVNTQHA